LALPNVTLVNPTNLSYPFGGIEIYGTDLTTTSLSGNFLDTTKYVLSTINSGYTSLSFDGKLELGFGVTAGSSAKADIVNTVGQAFDIGVEFEYGASGFGIINRTVLLRWYFEEIASPLNYVSFSLIYEKGQFNIEVYCFAGKVSQATIRGIDPYGLLGFRVKRTEKLLTLQTKYKFQDGTIGYSDILIVHDFLLSEMRHSFSVENNINPPNSSYSIKLALLTYSYIVSVMSYEAAIKNYTASYIKAEAKLDVTISNKLIIGFVDSTWLDTGIAITTSGVNRYSTFSSIYDTSINVYSAYSRADSFDLGDGFKWGLDYLVSKEKRNSRLASPTIWDPYTYRINLENWKSGYTFADDLKFKSFVVVKENDNEAWHPKVRRGAYYLRDTAYYYHSNESVLVFLKEKDVKSYYTGDPGRSYLEVPFLPKTGAPVSVTRQQYNANDGNITDKYKFKKVDKFTGIIVEGTELDTSENPEYIDKTKQEFILTVNENYLVNDWPIPLFKNGSTWDGATDPVTKKYLREFNTPSYYRFFPAKVSLEQGYLDFTRKDIFKRKKPLGEFYGTKYYGQLVYGQKLDTYGDYGVNPVDGSVLVYLANDYYDLGSVSYAYAYPVSFDFNDIYTEGIGTDIVSPTSQDLNSFDFLSESNGNSYQFSNVTQFPIIESSMTIYVFDPETNTLDLDPVTFASNWQEVDALASHVDGKFYEVNIGSGIIKFGKVVPPAGNKIYASYRVGLRIEYEPVNSTEYRTERRVDLNKNKYTSAYGFYSLSRKNPIPDKVILSSNKLFATTSDYLRLKVVIKDKFDNIMQGIRVTFHSTDAYGNFSNKVSISDSRGEAATYFSSSGYLEQLGIAAFFYRPSVSPSSPGSINSSILGNADGLIGNVLHLSQPILDDVGDMYLFKIYSDSTQIAMLFNYEKLQGGVKTVYTYVGKDINGIDVVEILKPIRKEGAGSESGSLVFDRPLSQPLYPLESNYEPNLVGYYVVGSRRTSFYATIESGLSILTSNEVDVYVSYIEIQKHLFTLSYLTDPLQPWIRSPYGLQIGRATYLNPY